jgi:hypothetical protein
MVHNTNVCNIIIARKVTLCGMEFHFTESDRYGNYDFEYRLEKYIHFGLAIDDKRASLSYVDGTDEKTVVFIDSVWYNGTCDASNEQMEECLRCVFAKAEASLKSKLLAIEKRKDDMESTLKCFAGLDIGKSEAKV